MFNSHYPNFVNVRSEGNCQFSVLIRRTEFALSAPYNTNIIIIIIINLNVDIGVILCTGQETIPENILSPTFSIRHLLLWWVCRMSGAQKLKIRT